MQDAMKGIRVLEVAQWWFVPAAGAVLADWGAEVVTVVEWPKGFAGDQWPNAIRIELEHVTESERRIRVPAENLPESA